MTARPLSRTRRLIAGIALSVAVLAGAWTVYLLKVGGFDVKVFGFKITTHQIVHPVLLGVAAIATLVLVGGVRHVRETVSTAVGALDDRVVASGIAAATVVVGLAFCTMSASGSDSYGYVSQADQWLSGELPIRQPWVNDAPWPSARWSFAPLGYLPQSAYWPGGDPASIVPTYAAGLPLLMAAAKLVGGQYALFAVVPLSGGLLVLATFAIGRRLGSSRAGLIAAWLVATSPAFLYMLMWPMTDVPVAAAWALSFALLLGGSVAGAMGAGLAAGAAVLIRPNLTFLVGVLALRYALVAWRADAAERARQLRRLAAFVAGVMPGVVALGLINWHLYGSPLQASYAQTEGFFGLAHVGPNLQRYFSWLIDSQTPVVLAGLAALVLPLRWIWPGVSDRSIFVVMASFTLAIWGFYSLFLVFDMWWYLRFLLPCWPLMMVGVASIGLAIARIWRPLSTVAIAAALLVLGVRGISTSTDRSAFELWMGERRYITTAEHVRTATDDNSVVLSIQHSGSLRYYGGRVTLRFDNIDPAWLDQAVAWLSARGAHPYLLAEDWEMPVFRSRFAGQRTLAELDLPPVMVYTGAGTIYLYDLHAGIPRGSVDTVLESYRGPRSVPPAPPPRLVLRR